MATYRVNCHYTSIWQTAIIPTLITLFIWAGVFLIPLIMTNFTLPKWFWIILFIGGFIIGLIVAVLSYNLVLKTAKLNRSELILNDCRLKLQRGKVTQEIDFSNPHRVNIAAGLRGNDISGAGISIDPFDIVININGISREEVIRLFPDNSFVADFVPSGEGAGLGFELSADQESISFFKGLLECLWKNREQNEYFQIFHKFLWDRQPQSAFHYIKKISPLNRSFEDERLINELKTKFLDDLTDSTVRVTADYLVGWEYPPSYKDSKNQQPDYYIMPLGYISAEVSSLNMEEGSILLIKGKDENNNPLQLTFKWYDINSKYYKEANLLVRFVNAMYFTLKTL